MARVVFGVSDEVRAAERERAERMASVNAFREEWFSTDLCVRIACAREAIIYECMADATPKRRRKAK
jgi:hypothetical protein